MLNESIASDAAASVAPVSIRETLPLDAIVPSTTKVQTERRRFFAKDALTELASSIQQVGVIQPIVVRPLAEHEGGVGFEIVAGERRWRAAQEAGLAEIPAVVRQLDDEAVLQIQLIENLSRADLDPLTEAEGYDELLQTGITVDEIAAKLAKSVAYIYQRLKLLALCKEGRKAYRDGAISAAVALLIARIPSPEVQKQALKDATEKDWQGDAPTYREIQSIIVNRYMLQLDKAPFDTKSADLVPSAGACTDCPKRTGNQPQLFADVKRGDTCTDTACFAAKKAAHVAKRRTDAIAVGRRVIEGEEAATIMKRGAWDMKGYINVDRECYADEKRRTYRKILGNQMPPPALILSPDTGDYIEIASTDEIHAALKSKGLKTAGHDQLRATDHKRRDAEKKAKLDSQFRTWLLQKIRDKAPNAPDHELLRAVAESFYAATFYEGRKRLARLYRWKQPKKDGSAAPDTPWDFMPTATTAEITKFLLDCTLIAEVHASAYDTRKPGRLYAAAERAGLDVAKLRKEFDPKVHLGELKPVEKPAKPAKTGAKPAGKTPARKR